jgi:hypothetical protein
LTSKVNLHSLRIALPSDTDLSGFVLAVVFKTNKMPGTKVPKLKLPWKPIRKRQLPQAKENLEFGE